MKKLRFLVVDDEPGTCPCLEQALTEAFPSAIVDTAFNAPQACDAVQRSVREQRHYTAAVVDACLAVDDDISKSFAASTSLCFQILEECPETLLFHMTAFPAALHNDWRLASNAVKPRSFFISKAHGWTGNLIQTLRGIFEGKLLFLSSQSSEIVKITASIERLFCERQLDASTLTKLSARQFEELVAEIWQSFGYTVELTKRTRDGGRDIIAARKAEADLRLLIECKRFAPQRTVGVSFVRALYGVKIHEGATKAILATTSSFTQPANQFFEAHRWELEPRDRDGILEWIRIAKR